MMKHMFIVHPFKQNSYNVTFLKGWNINPKLVVSKGNGGFGESWLLLWQVHSSTILLWYRHLPFMMDKKYLSFYRHHTATVHPLLLMHIPQPSFPLFPSTMHIPLPQVPLFLHNAHPSDTISPFPPYNAHPSATIKPLPPLCTSLSHNSPFPSLSKFSLPLVIT